MSEKTSAERIAAMYTPPGIDPAFVGQLAIDIQRAIDEAVDRDRVAGRKGVYFPATFQRHDSDLTVSISERGDDFELVVVPVRSGPCRYYAIHPNGEMVDLAPPPDTRGPEVGDIAGWETLKKLAEEQFEVRAKHARDGKQAATESGDTSEVQCFACELQMLARGFDAWLMAYHLMRRAEVEARMGGQG